MKLKRLGNQVYEMTGKYLFSVSATDRHTSLVNNEDWDDKNESWLSYRTRIKPEMELEKHKVEVFTQRLVDSYNG